MLRGIPNMVTLRPADAVEAAEAWRAALLRTSGPSTLILTRQKLPALERNADGARDIARGGYILHEPADTPRAIVIGTGSEVHIAVAAARQLAADGVPTRVVSMPSWEVFEAQDPAWRERVLPAAITARVSIEAAATFGWERFIGARGIAIGIDHFGASAPGERLFTEFGFTAERVVDAVRSLA
jgi:transketolase